MKTDILYLNDQFEVEQGSSSEKGPMGWPFLVSYNFISIVEEHLGEFYILSNNLLGRAGRLGLVEFMKGGLWREYDDIASEILMYPHRGQWPHHS